MRRLAWLVCAPLLASTLVACAGSPRQQVRLADSAEPALAHPREDEPLSSVTPLRIAVASVISPRETFRSYQDLIGYLGNRVGRATEFIQRATYGEINALVRSGKLDLAFVCTLAFVEGRREFGMELLAAPVVRGRAEYFSYIVVPISSEATSLADLKGTVFAFTDPLSNSGWLAPTYQLLKRGQAPDAFFQRVIYTYSHDNSIRAVADRLVDGAAVDSLVYDGRMERQPELKRRLRVVERFGPFAAPPVVVNPALSGERKAALQTTLLSMHEDPEGRRILEDLGIDRFTILDDHAYDSVRAMRDAQQAAQLAAR